MTTREQAMQWWNTLGSASKTRMCDIYTEIVGSVRRWEKLTGREIEEIFSKENKTENIYLNRLKEQYKETLKDENSLIKTLRVSNYTGMRNFCLDTELLDFNTIELMEYEVNRSF